MLVAFTMLHPESYPYHPCKAHEWVCESCHLKELSFSGLCEFQEITATSPKTINSIDIVNFKSHRKHLSVANLNTQSMVSLFDEFK